MKKHYLFKSVAVSAALLAANGVQAETNVKTGVVPEEIYQKMISMYEVSPNGKYSCGYDIMQENSASFDMEEEKVVIYTKYTTENPIYNMVWDVANDGTVVGKYGGDYGGSKTKIFYAKGDEWHDLAVPEGLKENGCARCISADASLIAGYAPLADEKTVFGQDILCPVLWVKNGDLYAPQLLPFPKEDWFGETTMRAMAEHMSDDGSVIVGRLTDHSGWGNQVIVWVKNNETGEYSYKLYGEQYTYNLEAEKPGPAPKESDYVHSEEGTPEYEAEMEAYYEAYYVWLNKRNGGFSTTSLLDELAIAVSGNGQYIACSYKNTTNGGQIPFYINLKNDEITEITEAENAAPRNMTNDGKMVYVSPTVGDVRQTYIASSKADIQTAQDWIKAEFGLDLTPFYEEHGLSVSGIGSIDTNATTWTFYQPDSANQGYSFDYFVKKMDDGSVVASMLDSKLTARVEGRTLYLNEDGCNVEVVDMAGNILIQVKNSGNEVNLSGLSNGVYIMKVKKGTDSVVLKTVVK